MFFGFVFWNELVAKNRFCNIFVTNNKNKLVELRIEVADTGSSRRKGLMFRKSLDKNSGMLFVFKNERGLSFWMKNTHIPLSVAYINRNGIINEIYTMKPLDISVTYPSVYPAMYALEVNSGWFKKNNITTGCRIVLSGCLGK